MRRPRTGGLAARWPGADSKTTFAAAEVQSKWLVQLVPLVGRHACSPCTAAPSRCLCAALASALEGCALFCAQDVQHASDRGIDCLVSCRATSVDLEAGLAALAVEPRSNTTILLKLGPSTLTGVLVLAHLAAAKAEQQPSPVLACPAPLWPKRVTAGEVLSTARAGNFTFQVQARLRSSTNPRQSSLLPTSSLTCLGPCSTCPLGPATARGKHTQNAAPGCRSFH